MGETPTLTRQSCDLLPSTRKEPRLQGAPEPIAALNKVRIAETRLPWLEREPLVDLRDHCPDIALSDHICPYLRRTVADMLNAAQASLPLGMKLKASSALRTISMQKSGWDGYHKRMREEHPEWPLSALRRATNKYFAPYDQKAPPGHCTGGAVDVGLLDGEGKPIDLTFPTKGWQAAYTWSDLLAPETKANRMIMVDAMLGAGFSNCRDEYWHYSYGDSAWAVRVGEVVCPFGLIQPDVALEPLKADRAILRPEVSTERDGAGKRILATGIVKIPARTETKGYDWSVALLWASGLTTSLQIDAERLEDVPSALYIGDGEADWKPVNQMERDGHRCAICVVPSYDRAWITPVIPIKAEEPQS